ncbi:GTP cyclohydrolase II [Mycoplasma testudineum]|uniref:GTP cyclohydrolase II n=1 Tax=Mycoplasma testudineum TaxID=244584 RepID=A0A4R6IFF0_9MOLU|nr:GTP cyclohydrolase II RibA [Mycoplasma testudineum]OYD26903.1 hypothetical protein CG473_01005 [Mycoplasma testudineum]TDO20451.1 GTP cyclohydrolase II [Mycoplasma testudineum]
MYYLKIGNIDNKSLKNTFIEIKSFLAKHNINYFKDVVIEEDLLIYKGNNHRYIIKIARDIFQISSKNLGSNLIISKHKNIDKLDLEHNKVIFLFNDLEFKKSIAEVLDIVKNFKEIDKAIYVDFIYFDEFEISKEIKLKTENGELNMQVFKEPLTKTEFTVVWKGILEGTINLRIHHKCETSEIFDSIHCDCKIQLNNFKDVIFENGGMIIYSHEEGRGLGMLQKINAYYETINNGLDTVDAMLTITDRDELRLFDLAGKIVEYYGIKSVNMWTNNPRKIIPLVDRGIAVNRMRSLYQEANSKEQASYLETKKERMGHKI